MITDGKPSMTSITKFLGLNMNDTGETQLKLGEASTMKNFRITKDYKLEKMFGYNELYDVGDEIRANWVGKLGDTEMNIYVAGGKAYRDGSEIGTLTDDETTIFEFNQTLFFLNGHEYKYYNPSIPSPYPVFGDVTGYTPTIKITCTPAGIGDDFEPINLISPYRKVSFSADGTAKDFYLPETDIAVQSILIDGTPTSAYTTTPAEGKVTFTQAPGQGTDNVLIDYQKLNIEPSLKENITNNHYLQKFGLANDTRIFLFGNEEAKNRIYFSEPSGDGLVEYFPATNFIDVGSSNEAVTDISRQYDRLIISKESETYYATYDVITDSVGEAIITFPVFPLNNSHGMVATGQGQVLDNYVTTVDYSGIIQWINTQSKDERNANIISERVNEWLQERDLSKAITLDYQEEKEYWVAIDNEVLIYNYANGTFYILDFPDNVRTLCTHNGDIYMGTDTAIMKFDEILTSYNGQLIDAEWQSGFYDFEAEYKRKTMRILWITLKPQEKTYMSINYITDRNVGMNQREINETTFSYDIWNYADFMYTSGLKVKPYKIKLKAKKFAFLKLIIKSNKLDYKLIVDSISIQKAYGGFVK